MHMINNFKKFFSEHKFYILSMLIFTICFSAIVSQVVLYADDFALDQKASMHSISVILNEFKTIYLTWGGGPTPGFAIIVLMFGLVFWKILNIFMVTASVYMATDIIIPKSKRTDKNQAIISSIMWCLILVMSISVARETIFWFDGSMAYVLTTFLTFAYFYFCYKIIIDKKKTFKKDYVLLSVLGFFSGWNGPQAGAISICLIVCLILWQRFYKKEKINKVVLTSLIFTIIGFGILYFAPGNSGRMATFEEYNNLDLFGKVLYRIPNIIPLMFDHITYPMFNIPTYLVLASLLMVFLSFANLKQKNIKRKKFISLISLFIILYNVCYLIYVNTGEGLALHNVLNLIYNFSVIEQTGTFLSFMVVFKFVLAILYLLSLIYISFENSLISKRPTILLVTLSAVASQLIMVMSPYSPFRTTYITIFFLILLIAVLGYNLRENKNYIIASMLVALLFYNIQLGIIVAIMYGVFYVVNKNEKNELFIIITVLLLTGSSIYNNFYEYKVNRVINEQNVELIEKYKKNGQNGALVLYKLNDETYGFTPLYNEAEWIRKDVINYYDLKSDLEIKLIDFK